MKYKSILYLLVICANSAIGQTMDTLPKDSAEGETIFLHRGRPSGHVRLHKEQYVSRENVTLATFNLPPTPVENEIVDMESLECKALLNRDTSALRRLWLRDFTQVAPQNDLLLGNNPIPYYVSLKRFVEKLTDLGNTVITSGKESFIILNTNGKLEELKERTYQHTWVRETFSWRLAAKIH